MIFWTPLWVQCDFRARESIDGHAIPWIIRVVRNGQQDEQFGAALMLRSPYPAHYFDTHLIVLIMNKSMPSRQSNNKKFNFSVDAFRKFDYHDKYMQTKQVVIPADLHAEVRIYAAQNDRQIGDVTANALRHWLKFGDAKTKTKKAKRDERCA